MADRLESRQSEHDAAVRAAASIYRDKGRVVSTNPGGEKNEDWGGYYIDVIAKESHSSSSAWITEIETEDSVSEAEARGQWSDYDDTYKVWHLAVPTVVEDKAKELLRRFNITNCNLVTWERNNEGGHTFWGLPGTKAV